MISLVYAAKLNRSGYVIINIHYNLDGSEEGQTKAQKGTCSGHTAGRGRQAHVCMLQSFCPAYADPRAWHHRMVLSGPHKGQSV